METLLAPVADRPEEGETRTAPAEAGEALKTVSAHAAPTAAREAAARFVLMGRDQSGEVGWPGVFRTALCFLGEPKLRFFSSGMNRSNFPKT
ncbi:hypothetical protein GCM10022221_62190 [Actinocorallia aurea]